MSQPPITVPSNQGPITVLVCALGGEGGGVLAEWLYQTAVRAGHRAQATSVPGVAQRTGATTYYFEMLRQPGGGDAPALFSLTPVPGGVDLLISSELLETTRQVSLGMSHPARTRILSSTARTLTVAEKMPMSDGRADSLALLRVLQTQACEVGLHDFTALAQQAGTVISAVLFGAVAASGVLPLARPQCEETIRASGKGVEASLRGFELGYAAVAGQRALADPVRAALQEAPAPDLRVLGRARVAAYQDEAYARLYDQRLARIRAAAPDGRRDEIEAETARWLALWMSYDDIVRVAALKLSPSRLQRVRREVGATDDEVVRVYDHFKPGVPELAALLPAGLARWVLAWDRRRVAAGREPFALPLRVATHGVGGALALRVLASLKGWRRHGSRFAEEQALIERWLGAVERGCREDAALGLELARCGRLIKGYGSTNERGKANLLHLVDHVATLPRGAAERADAVRATREAALTDDAGRALDATLAAQGAAPRPPREQPVRWFKRRPAT